MKTEREKKNFEKKTNLIYFQFTLNQSCALPQHTFHIFCIFPFDSTCASVCLGLRTKASPFKLLLRMYVKLKSIDATSVDIKFATRNYGFCVQKPLSNAISIIED